MKAFLEYVAEDIISKHGTNLSNVAVVFPNKRASLFMNQYLVKIAKKPIWSPRYITISDLFRSKSSHTVTDNIKAISILYKTYCKYVATDESLDKFWGWGEILLADFDDLDKNLGDSELVFSNISDLHALDSIDYLDEEKRNILKHFFSEFTDDYDSKLKRNFEKLWNQLAIIYKDFNDEMRNENLVYEGALYKEVAENAENLDWEFSKYIFVGFNMIQKSEQKLFKSLKDKGLASFYWDFDDYYISGDKQEAGRFIEKYLVKFPNELNILDKNIYNNFTNQKDITFFSASSENIQARYINQWLKENNRLEAGAKTAIVLADESLLQSVIHYLPEEVADKANITIGFPLFQSPVTSFVENFISLHLYGYNVSQHLFLLKQVDYLLLHPYTHYLTENARTISKTLHDERIYFPKEDELCTDERMSLLFQAIDNSRSEMCEILIKRLIEILKTLGEESEKQRISNLLAEGKDPDTTTPTFEEQFMQESVFKMYSIINRIKDLLCNNDIVIDPATMLRLLDQIIKQTSMPLHGEPAVGLQIMGVLETRNLDFDHVLILSCNEGNLPKGLFDSSIIPYSVRNAHELTTNDNKVAIYAYYFYRLLQRCSDVGISYNCSTEDGQTGQMSRFMTQILAETDTKQTNISHYSLTAKQLPSVVTSSMVLKDEKILEILNNKKFISPSALNDYLRCPLLFYFKNIAGLREPDACDIDDNRLFGTIFHTTAELLYKNICNSEGIVTKEAIDNLLKDKFKNTIYRLIDEAFSKEIFRNRKPNYDGLQLINREAISLYIIKLLKADIEIAPFKIVGLETEVYENISFEVNGAPKDIIIGGKIDRIDNIKGKDGKDSLRIVDYKTGVVTPKVMDDVASIFNPDNIGKHSDYYLQIMLYSIITRNFDKPFILQDKEIAALNKQNIRVIPFLMFIQKNGRNNETVLKIKDGKGSKDINDILEYEDEFRDNLRILLSEIFNKEKGFEPTSDVNQCTNCAYVRICKGK